MPEEKRETYAEFIASNGAVTKEEALGHLVQSLVGLQTAFLQGNATLAELGAHAEFQAVSAALIGIVVSIPTPDGIVTTSEICKGCVWDRYCALHEDLVGPMPLGYPAVPHTH